MSKRGHTEEQIPLALRQAQGGTKISDICREQGISEATYYVWKKKYAGLELSELWKQHRRDTRNLPLIAT